MKYAKYIFVVLLFVLLCGCGVLSQRLPFVPTIRCDTKGITALYYHLEDAQDIVNMFAREEKAKAVAYTAKLSVLGRAKPIFNETVTLSYPVDVNLLKVRTTQGDEGYMLRKSLECSAKD